jgi:hypothetical protein
MRELGVVIFHDTLWDLRPDPQWSRADMGAPVCGGDYEGYPVLTFKRDFGVSLVQVTKRGIRLMEPG